jgi:hypothetical protein
MIKTRKLRRHSKKRTKKMTNARRKKTLRHHNTRRAKKITNTRIKTVCLHKNNTRKNKIGGGPKKKPSLVKENLVDFQTTQQLEKQNAKKQQYALEKNKPLKIVRDAYGSSNMEPVDKPAAVRGAPNIDSFYSDSDDSDDEPVDKPKEYTRAELEAATIHELHTDEDLLKQFFIVMFKYTLAKIEIKTLMSLTEDDLNVIILYFRDIMLKKRQGLQPSIDPENIGVVVHGETEKDHDKFNLGFFPNIEMQFLVPESMSLVISYNPTGVDTFKEALDNAFHYKSYVFSKFNSDNPLVPAMRQGTYNADKEPEVIKKAMGFYLRLNDGTHVKLAHFNCAIEYYNKLNPGNRLTLDNYTNATISFDVSLEFIDRLTRIISNITQGMESDKERGSKKQKIKLYQLCCRPYVATAKITVELRNLWGALANLGSPHVEISREGVIGLSTASNSGFVPRPGQDGIYYSQTASVEAQPDESSKFNYVVEKIKVLAGQIDVVPAGYNLEQAKIYWFRKLVNYLNMINFEFARRGLSVPTGATILSSLTSANADVIISDNPYRTATAPSQQSPSLTRSEVEQCEWITQTQTDKGPVTFKNVEYLFKAIPDPVVQVEYCDRPSGMYDLSQDSQDMDPDILERYATAAATWPATAGVWQHARTQPADATDKLAWQDVRRQRYPATAAPKLRDDSSSWASADAHQQVSSPRAAAGPNERSEEYHEDITSFLADD